MDNLIFSLNATLPIFFTMLLGSFFKRVGLIDEAFSAKMNKFAFAVALPALLFQDISAVDIRESWNGGFVLFCFIATFLSITGVTVLSFFVVKREERGEFVQGAYRSSAAILGIAIYPEYLWYIWNGTAYDYRNGTALQCVCGNCPVFIKTGTEKNG